MIWNPNKECMSREQMRALQGKRLQKLVQYVYHNVPFYRHKMQAMDVAPEDIKSIDDKIGFLLRREGDDRSSPNRLFPSACGSPQSLRFGVPGLRTLGRRHVRSPDGLSVHSNGELTRNSSLQ